MGYYGSMPRTKHVVISVIAIILLLLAIAIMGSFSKKNESITTVSVNGLFTEGMPELTVETRVKENKQSIRDAFLAKLGQMPNSASVATVEEPDAVEIESDVASTAPPSFDWGMWTARLEEFDKKKIVADTILHDFKEQLQVAEEKRAQLMTLIATTTATSSSQSNVLDTQIACLDTQIEREMLIVKELEGIGTTSLGLLYTALMGEIELQVRSEEVTKLYDQTLQLEAKNSMLLSTYAVSAVNCERLHTDALPQAGTL